jgi:hypothetical protein
MSRRISAITSRLVTLLLLALCAIPAITASPTQSSDQSGSGDSKKQKGPTQTGSNSGRKTDPARGREVPGGQGGAKASCCGGTSKGKAKAKKGEKPGHNAGAPAENKPPTQNKPSGSKQDF